MWFIGQGGAGLHRRAAVGEPADNMENVIQNHGDVENRRGWTAALLHTRCGALATPRTRRYIHRVVGRKGCCQQLLSAASAKVPVRDADYTAKCT